MFRSSVMVSLLSVVVSVFSFVNQLIIARTFGAAAEMDAYLIGISVPYLVLGVMSGVMAYSVVPMQVRRKTSDPIGYSSFAGMVLIAFIVLAIALPFVGYLLSPVIVTITAPALTGELLLRAITIARISWLNVGLSLIVGCLVAFQNAARRFVVPALATLFPYAGMIIATLFFAPSLRIAALAWGMLAGYVAAIPVLYMGAGSELKFEITSVHRWRELYQLFARIPFGMASTLCFTVFGTVDAFLGARLGSGSISYLGYAQRLLIVLGNFVMLGPWTVIPPFLAEQSAIGDYQKFRDTLSRALAVVIFMAAPLALTLSVLKVSVIELLFERGAFDHRATLGVAGIISGMLVGMIAMICVTLLIKAMHAKDDVKGAALAGGLGATLYLILGASLSSRFGLWGIVVGYVFTWWILLFVCAWRLWGTYFLGKLLRAQFPMVQKLAAALVTLAIALFVSQSMLIRPLAEVGHISLIVRLVAVIVLSLLTFIVAALAFFGGTSGISAFLLGPETPRRSESG